MQLGVAEILNKISKLPTKKEKIAALQEQQNNQVLTLLLKMSFDEGLRWKIPEGVPPYKPAEDSDQQGLLYREARKLYLFLDIPESAKLTQLKREQLFLNLLETLHPDDAKLLLAVKDKKLLAPGITKKLVEEALPNLLK